jgi:hypothetical protein
MKRSIIALATILVFMLPAFAVQAGGLGDVEKGMTRDKVRALVGEPDTVNSYPTWKRFVPRMGRWSTDRKRMDWVYEGKGRVIFSHNQYVDDYKVLKVITASDAGG